MAHCGLLVPAEPKVAGRLHITRATHHPPVIEMVVNERWKGACKGEFMYRGSSRPSYCASCSLNMLVVRGLIKLFPSESLSRLTSAAATRLIRHKLLPTTCQ
ncbi:hypothetical protein PAXRUDRAFT_447563 [Paxillus rubicundulus Ve08.2h10]|uniref:Uncharacterized protein n=1 Tax=Paxillus rubicundulus Ve08.2h10 TaxID=930991 RepID=A0A0D0DBF2_9AGAM|nr:hypothetical protein PAXRUDRAFT_447563 [Paxillus rubicundulus Ve08.2h10]